MPSAASDRSRWFGARWYVSITTPLLVVFTSVNDSVVGSRPSLKNGLPLPNRQGHDHELDDVDEIELQQEMHERAAPVDEDVLAGLPLACNRSATSPLKSVAFHSRGSSRVVEATYFGRLFIRSPIGSPDLEGQVVTKPS